MSVPNVMGGLTVDEVNVAQMYCVLVLCKEQTEEDQAFTLKHGQERVVTANIGDELTIVEDCGSYEASYTVLLGEEIQEQGRGS